MKVLTKQWIKEFDKMAYYVNKCIERDESGYVLIVAGRDLLRLGELQSQSKHQEAFDLLKDIRQRLLAWQ